MSRIVFIVIVISLAIFAYIHFGRDDTETAESEHEAELKLESKEHSYNKKLLEIPDQSNRFFRKAAQAYLKGKYAESASEIRNASHLLSSELTSERLDAQYLSTVLIDLEDLAEKVDQGKVYSVDALWYEFAKAEGSLAYLNLIRGQAYLEQGDANKAVPHIHKSTGIIYRIAQSLETSLKPDVESKLKQVNEELLKWAPDNDYPVARLKQKVDSLKLFLEPEDVTYIAPEKILIKQKIPEHGL